MINQKDDGYRGIWYYNQPSHDEYVFKYSGGLATYPSNHIPFAVYAEKVHKTFFCYGASAKDQNRLLHAVSYYDHQRHEVPRPTILLDKQTDDAHDNPTISIDGDGFIWIFSSSHGTSRPSYIHKSTVPYSIDQFEHVLTTNFSYPECWYVDSAGFCFLRTHYDKGRRFLQCTTSQNGKQWSKPQQLAQIERGHYQISWKHGSKIGTAFNYHPTQGGLNARTNLYYLETSDFGQHWTTIRGEARLPLKKIQNDALVHDYARDQRLVYLIDMDFDEKGYPILLYVVSKGFESGPKNDPRIWTIAHWNGNEWIFSGQITSSSNYDVGSLHILSSENWVIMGPTQPGVQPYNPGGEICLWNSTNQGQTWEMKQQLTNQSKYNHTYVRKPVHAHPEFLGFWADGDTRRLSQSRLYFYDFVKFKVRQLPQLMDSDTFRFD